MIKYNIVVNNLITKYNNKIIKILIYKFIIK